MIVIDLPMRTYSKANAREHWRSRWRRGKQEKEAAYYATPKASVPCTVTFTRFGPQPLDDDNIRGAFKAVRDGVAMRLGVDDADPRVTWEYRQQRSRTHAVRIEIDEGRLVETPHDEQEAPPTE